MCGGGYRMFPWQVGTASPPPSPPPPASVREDPVEVLKMRLARGEITLDECQKLVAVLSLAGSQPR
jgi:hypothetical protein